MLTNANKLIGLFLRATDGGIGKVKDLYFDDETWRIQYFVAETGSWLFERKVLISPQSAEEPDWDEKIIPVSLTKMQIENSPPIEEDQPVSRQAQTRLAGYFNWGAYWTGYLGPGPSGVPTLRETPTKEDTAADPHLRSYEEVKNYTIQARDGDIGHVEDFVIQTDEWALRYLIVDTRDWLPGRKVLVSPAWITDLDWVQTHLRVDLPLETIRNAPEFHPEESLTRQQEEQLYAYYGFTPYWNP